MVASTTPIPLGTVALACVRPFERWQCAGHRKPCPWVNCKHHLTNIGFPRRGRIGAPQFGCALDVLDKAPRSHTLNEVGALLGMTREAVRQIEEQAIRKLRVECKRHGVKWEDFCHAAGFPEPEHIDHGDTTYFYRRWSESRKRYMERLRRAARREP